MSATVDPRAASTTVLDGPADLVNEEIVPIDLVEVDGVAVGVPRLMPGAAEWATVRAAEASADAYREAALGQLDRRGEVPCVDITAAVNFRLNAGTAVASAAVGLEAYANFHLNRLAPGTAGDAAEQALNERYAEELPAIFDVNPRPTKAGGPTSGVCRALRHFSGMPSAAGQ